jgi:hypothetical protein
MFSSWSRQLVDFGGVVMDCNMTANCVSSPDVLIFSTQCDPLRPAAIKVL